MTEREAYKFLGWPEEGHLEGFILPLSGQDDDCSISVCSCGRRLIHYNGPFAESCLSCGEKLVYLSEVTE